MRGTLPYCSRLICELTFEATLFMPRAFAPAENVFKALSEEKGRIQKSTGVRRKTVLSSIGVITVPTATLATPENAA